MRHIIHLESHLESDKELHYKIANHFFYVCNQSGKHIYKRLLRKEEKIGLIVINDDLIIMHYNLDLTGESVSQDNINEVVVIKSYNEAPSFPRVVFRAGKIKEFSYDKELKIVFEKFGKTFTLGGDYNVEELK